MRGLPGAFHASSILARSTVRVAIWSLAGPTASKTLLMRFKQLRERDTLHAAAHQLNGRGPEGGTGKSDLLLMARPTYVYEAHRSSIFH